MYCIHLRNNGCLISALVASMIHPGPSNTWGPKKGQQPRLFFAVELCGDLRDPGLAEGLVGASCFKALDDGLGCAAGASWSCCGAAVRGTRWAPDDKKLPRTVPLGRSSMEPQGCARPRVGRGSQWKRCIFMAVYRTEIRMNLYIMGNSWWSNGKICFQKWQWIMMMISASSFPCVQLFGLYFGAAVCIIMIW